MRTAFAVALVIASGAAVDLSAEPVLIQPGSSYVVSNVLTRDGTFDTSGAFILPSGYVAGIFGRELSNDARTGCQLCSSGDPLNLSASFELRGPSYRAGGPVFAVWGAGTLNFTTPTVTVPFDIPPPQVPFYAVAPFLLTGHIELFGEPGSVPIFAGDIIGFGHARALLLGSGNSLTFGNVLEFQFTRDPAEPVPEPAAVTLLVTGLAALGARARRRRRTSRADVIPGPVDP
jgi:hypothetical protein